MVIKSTVNALRERPHDERHAFAVLCAIVVMVACGVAWSVAFVVDPNNRAVTDSSYYSADQAAAAASFDSAATSPITSDMRADAVPADDSNLPLDQDGALTATESDITVPASIPVDTSFQLQTNSAAAELEAALQAY